MLFLNLGLALASTPPIFAAVIISLTNLVNSFVNIKSFFFPSQEEQINILDPNSVIDQSSISQYKTSLKDIITYFQGVTNSNTKNIVDSLRQLGSLNNYKKCNILYYK